MLYKYRMYCETEETYVYVWLDSEDDPPSLCPNNTNHIIDSNSISIVEKNSEPAVNDSNQLIVAPTLSNYNNKVLFRKSWYYNIQGGQDFIQPINFDTEILLFGGEYEIVGNVHSGDFIDVTVTDDDNILGYGAGFVVSQFIEEEKIMPGQYTVINPLWKQIKCMNAAATIPEFLYITIRYKSYGSTPENDIKLIVRLFPWR